MQPKCWHGSTFSWGHYFLVNNIKKEKGTVILFESQDENCKLGKAQCSSTLGLSTPTKMSQVVTNCLTLTSADRLKGIRFQHWTKLLRVRTVITGITRDHWSLLFVEIAKPTQVRN